MDQHPLTEYRCACGKLLFRGLLLLSVVEVKCKRCGTLKLFRDPSFTNTSTSVRASADKSAGREVSPGAPVSFVLTIYDDGRVYDACRTAEYVLAYPRETLLKMSIDELCPRLRESFRRHQGFGGQVGGQALFRDAPIPRETKSTEGLKPYQIENNAFLLRDGRKLPVKSYFIRSDVPPEAYHIVNIISS